ncbi:hypothetical protein LEP1GSC034_2106 [Leptospira interrogans str. 2003000735]|uniref:Tetratricopeptide repeat protein n=2 Tax=Leptospira interrogans TaxID=173 RepID=A0A829D4V4_LEPIR|nr:hypothetical protein [Leptospira interrogans]EMY03196.1 hypothetical protein LEP1GSC029_4302 [Leptospira interrogans str. 2002000626]EMY27270.1 hypothetical protein LEP1GSC115_3939 [Leptospira interrogans serovar Australis str. 200703203]EKN90451.1 hypothetical protein LEP1GSC027_1855 [Leptospira interrogans str. 2002000624]EKQ35768.1 hypothetical protein LEP1GSC025_2490 [Leptospira interrogans str. 2002000621]EKQ46766.1 hypothetical protein LEP1GSC026_3335 [Leptospira interrogans str. 2002
MRTRKNFTSIWDELDYLYCKILKWFYSSTPNYTKSKLFADRLGKLLNKIKPGPMAIRIEEYRSLVYEVKGDLAGAIRHRRREIKLLKRLLSLSEYPKLSSELVGDYSDLVDRLILLSILYQNIGFSQKAINCLKEAKELSKRHRFHFPAGKLLDTYNQQK